MKVESIPVDIEMPVWFCDETSGGCGQKFGVYMKSVNDYWGNPERPPYCPSCGKVVRDRKDLIDQINKDLRESLKRGDDMDFDMDALLREITLDRAELDRAELETK